MAIILHKNIPELELHAPKGFTLGTTNSMSYAIRTEGDVADYQDIEYLPAAINFVDGNLPPPTLVLGDIYVIIDGGGGVVDPAWNGIPFNSWTRFDSAAWNGVAAVDGFQCYDKTAKEYKSFNGTVWAAVGVGTDLSLGPISATAMDVNSSTGTNVTLTAADGTFAGLMTAAKFNEVVTNNAKVSFPEAPNDGQDYVRNSLAWTVLAGGDTNLGTDNLTLSGAVVRTYNIDGNELKFIDGANNKLKVTPTGVGIGNIGIPSADLHIDGTLFVDGAQSTFRGSGATSGTASLIAGTATKDFFKVDNAGNITAEAVGGVFTQWTFGNLLSSGYGRMNFSNDLGDVGYITTTGSTVVNAGEPLRVGALTYYANSIANKVLHYDNSTLGTYWVTSGAATDANCDMKLNTTGLILGNGIGATTISAKLQVKGAGSTIFKAQNSVGVDSFTVEENGDIKATRAGGAASFYDFGNTTASAVSLLTFRSNLGILGYTTWTGSTYVNALEYLRIGAITHHYAALATRVLHYDNTSSGTYWVTSGVANDANTDMRLNATGLKIGTGIGADTLTHKFHVEGSTLLDGNLGLFGATPIAQPTTAIIAPAVVSGGGTTMTDTDTVDGYTYPQAIKALRNLGILA